LTASDFSALKLNYAEARSNFAFDVGLRRYEKEEFIATMKQETAVVMEELMVSRCRLKP